MIEYTITTAEAGPGGNSQGSGAPVWSRTFLQPLTSSALTPFSLSVLAEMAGRGWYNHYDRLGFDPAPKSRVVRSLHGRPYFTLSLSAQLEAQQAGVEPPALLVNGAVRPLARWEKPGLLAGLKLRGSAAKVAGVLPALSDELEAAAAKGRTWLERVRAMRWSQAEILQIMEEIERVGSETLRLYLGARQTFEFAKLRLLALLPGPSTAQHLASLNAALAAEGESLKAAIAPRLAALARTAAAEPEAISFLAAGDYANWANRLPDGPFVAGLRALLDAYGHRCAGEGELMTPRWSEDPSLLLSAVAGQCAAGQSAGQIAAPQMQPTAPDEGPFLALIDGKRRKEAQTLLAQARQALPLQSRALDVHAYTLAGTRIWALAAGHEALSDGRLTAVDDIFFFELEESKEMMTGEWNISDRAGIHATAVERRAEWQRQQQTAAGELLIGDCEAFAPSWAKAAHHGQ